MYYISSTCVFSLMVGLFVWILSMSSQHLIINTAHHLHQYNTFQTNLGFIGTTHITSSHAEYVTLKITSSADTLGEQI